MRYAALTLALFGLFLGDGCSRPQSAAETVAPRDPAYYGRLAGLRASPDQRLRDELARIVEEGGTPEQLGQSDVAEKDNAAVVLMGLFPAGKIELVGKATEELMPPGRLQVRCGQAEKGRRIAETVRCPTASRPGGFAAASLRFRHCLRGRFSGRREVHRRGLDLCPPRGVSGGRGDRRRRPRRGDRIAPVHVAAGIVPGRRKTRRGPAGSRLPAHQGFCGAASDRGGTSARPKSSQDTARDGPGSTAVVAQRRRRLDRRPGRGNARL